MVTEGVAAATGAGRGGSGAIYTSLRGGNSLISEKLVPPPRFGPASAISGSKAIFGGSSATAEDMCPAWRAVALTLEVMKSLGASSSVGAAGGAGLFPAAAVAAAALGVNCADRFRVSVPGAGGTTNFCSTCVGDVLVSVG